MGSPCPGQEFQASLAWRSSTRELGNMSRCRPRAKQPMIPAFDATWTRPGKICVGRAFWGYSTRTGISLVSIPGPDCWSVNTCINLSVQLADLASYPPVQTCE